MKLILVIGVVISVLSTIYRVIEYIYRNGNTVLPSYLNFMVFIVANFKDGYLGHKPRWFSLIYNITFTGFLFLILLGNRTYIQSDTGCEIIAGLSHATYLLSVILSVLNVFVTSQCLTNWKKWYELLLWVTAGNKKTIVWPLFLAFGISSVTTGVVAVAVPQFLKRNDDL